MLCLRADRGKSTSLIVGSALNLGPAEYGEYCYSQVERAQKMLDSGKTKKNRKNPNDPARFIGKMAVTKEGETADIKQYLDEDKIAEEAQYDGLYAVCTDLLDDEVGDILKVSEGRWQIEECFRIMKTDEGVKFSVSMGKNLL